MVAILGWWLSSIYFPCQERKGKDRMYLWFWTWSCVRKWWGNIVNSECCGTADRMCVVMLSVCGNTWLFMIYIHIVHACYSDIYLIIYPINYDILTFKYFPLCQYLTWRIFIGNSQLSVLPLCGQKFVLVSLGSFSPLFHLKRDFSSEEVWVRDYCCHHTSSYSTCGDTQDMH